MTGRSPSSSGLLPMPGSPSSSWAVYRARLSAMFRHADTQVVVAFWLLGAFALALSLVAPSLLTPRKKQA